MIWRDDDVGIGTKLEYLREVDDACQAANVVHTVAVQAYDLHTRPDLVEFILERHMDVQLHCWKHDDLSVNAAARDDLSLAVGKIFALFGKRPVVLYPPWNRSNYYVEVAAFDLGMIVSCKKLSLEQYIRVDGDVSERTINFHHWAAHERAQLPKALEIYRRRRP